MSLEQLLAWIPPGSPDEALARQVNFDQLPSHVAMIMDGNGRWAAQRHLPRVEGHRAGIDAVRDVVETSARLGIEVLTLYAFSVENWKRPRGNQHADDAAQGQSIRLEIGALHKNNIRFQTIGRIDELARRAERAGTGQAADGGKYRPAVQHRAQLRRTRGNRGCARRAISAGIPPDALDERRFWRTAVYGRPARPGSADPHERRDARE
jgi:undecaprenyl diphosphate synthase